MPGERAAGLPAPGEVWLVRLDRDGRYLDADAAGLGLLGIGLDDLRTHVVGDFVPADQREAVRANFATIIAGLPRLVVIESDVVRPDGTTVRTRLLPPVATADGEYLVRGYRLDSDRVGLATAEVAFVLERWRSAERRRDEAPPGSPERAAAEAEAEALRVLYHHAERERRDAG